MSGKLVEQIKQLNNQATAALKAENFVLAISFYTQLLNLDPRLKPMILVNRAEACRLAGQYEDALNDLNEAMTLPKRDWKMFNSRGITYAALGRYQEAVLDYEQAFALGGIPPEQMGRVYYVRGFSKFQLNQFKEALDDFNKAERHGFQQEDLFHFRGVAYFQVGEFLQSLVNFNKVIRSGNIHSDVLAYKVMACVRLDNRVAADNALEQLQLCFHGKQVPLSFRVLQAFGEAELMRGNDKEALRSFDLALKECSTEVDVYLVRSEIYRRLKNFKEALLDCEQAEKLKPSDFRVFLSRGYVMLSSSDYGGAIKNYSRAIELKKDCSSAWMGRGTALMRSKNYVGAEVDFQKVFQLSPKSADAHIELGRLYFLRGDYQKSISIFDALIVLEPRCSMGFSGRGTARAFLNEMEKAADDFNRARELDKVTKHVFLGRGKIKLFRGDFAAAIDRFNDAITFDDTDYWAYFLRGQARAQQGQVREAIHDFDAAIERSPPHHVHDVYFERAEALRKVGDYAEAILSYEKVIPVREGVLVGRASSNIALGDYAKALTDLQFIFEKLSDKYQALFFEMPEVRNSSLVANIYCLRARQKQRSEQHSEAISDFNQALTCQPSCAEAYAGRGQSQFILENYAAAVMDYDRAIILNDTQANYFLQRAEATRQLGLDAKSDYLKALNLDPEKVPLAFYRQRPEWFFRENFQSILVMMIADFVHKNDATMQRVRDSAKSGTKADKVKVDNFINGLENLKQARRHFNAIANKALESFNRADTHIEWLSFLKGCAHLILGEAEQALEFFGRDERPHALFFKANACRMLGRHDGAIRYLNDAIRLGLTHEACYFSRGLSYAALGEYDNARLDFSWAGRHSWVRCADGFLNLIFGDHQKAMANFDAVLHLDSQDPRALRGLDEAKKLLQLFFQHDRVIELGSQSPSFLGFQAELTSIFGVILAWGDPKTWSARFFELIESSEAASVTRVGFFGCDKKRNSDGGDLVRSRYPFARW